jgi:Protein of unknown function (DUF3187)
MIDGVTCAVLAPARRRRWPLMCLLLGGCGVGHAEEFFATRDENALTRGFYLPLASDSRADAGAVWAATLSIANTLNVESNANENLLVDGESDTLRLSYENSLRTDWRYRVTVPVIHDGGGFLDSTIDTWHRWFGFRRGYRPYYRTGILDYSYSGKGSLDMREPHTNLGDVSAEAGWYLADNASRTVSFWGGMEAPTGSVHNLTGDGAWDGAVWAHVAQRWARWQLAGEVGLTQPFGDQLFAGAAHHTSAFLRGAITREVTEDWSLRAQLDGQTGRVNGTDLRFLGSSLQMTLGTVHRLWRRWRLELGFAEDIAVNTAPDITFFLGIHD